VPAAIWALVSDPGVNLPLFVLGLSAAAVGVVNYGRWGNPFSFGDARYYGWLQRNPDFVRVLNTSGAFSLQHVWIGVLYYATGLPYVLKGVPPFAEFLRSRVAGIEAPPFTPLLTNPLSILLAGVGLYRLWLRPQLPSDSVAILRLTLIGHAFAVFVVLAFAFFTMRYRIDFAPFVTLAALVGYHSLSITTAGFEEAGRRRARIAAAGLCGLGILGSHYILLVHKVWSIAVPMDVRLTLLPFAPFARAAFGP
jgi:hypothetical protein